MLHLRTVRFLGHAGSDAELGYRRERDVTADLARDPLLGTAQALVDAGWSSGAVLARYEAARSRVRATADDVLPVEHLASAAEVDAAASTGARGPATSSPPRTARRRSRGACPRRTDRSPSPSRSTPR